MHRVCICAAPLLTLFTVSHSKATPNISIIPTVEELMQVAACILMVHTCVDRTNQRLIVMMHRHEYLHIYLLIE
jgi:hypothetical protein